MGKKKGSKSSNFIMQGGILAAASIISRIIGMLYRIPVTNMRSSSAVPPLTRSTISSS